MTEKEATTLAAWIEAALGDQDGPADDDDEAE